jgi:NTP pyrophosphatase (non-canonical NTP hydrolase)
MGRRGRSQLFTGSGRGSIQGSPQEFGVMSELPAGGFSIRDLQRRIFELYGAKDEARGDSATFLWLAEEFGELATALRSGTPEELALEMADVLAWLATLANIRGVDLESAVWRKYGEVCPGCRSTPCRCDPLEKP